MKLSIKKYDEVSVENDSDEEVTKHDCRVTPWRMESNAFESAEVSGTLEYMPLQDAMNELHRVCRDGAYVEVTAKYPRHDDFMNDMHALTRVTPDMIANHFGDKLKIMGVNYVLDERVQQNAELIRAQMSAAGRVEPQITEEVRRFIEDMMRNCNNVVQQFTVKMKCLK